MNDARYINEATQPGRQVRVSAGLFVLRYASSRGGLEAPTIVLSAFPGSGVEIVSADGAIEPRLYAPGDAVVVRAMQDSALQATIIPQRVGGSRDAQLVFERVSVSAPAFASAPAARPVAIAPRTLTQPGMLAHVARRGDVVVSPGEWICGPQLPMVIEGVEVVWPDRPADVDIVASCVMESRGRRSSPIVASGNFVGSRGKAAPIVALSLRLVGPGAASYRLNVDALFLGAQVRSVSGASVEVTGPSGREPLVGLRLTVGLVGEEPDLRSAYVPVAPRPYEPVAPAHDITPAHQAASPTALAKTQNPLRLKSDRVRLFRAERPGSQSH